MKNEITASEAEIVGEYLRVEQHSYQGYGAYIGFAIGGLVSFHFKLGPEIWPVVVLAPTLLGLVLAPTRKVHKVPRADLVDMEYDPINRKVTVLLDTDRTKRRQPVNLGN